MSQQFPDSPWFNGNFAPISFEAEADNVMVRGDMPKELRGTLYRNGPNPQFAPRDAPWNERYFHLTDPDGHELSFARPL